MLRIVRLMLVLAVTCAGLVAPVVQPVRAEEVVALETPDVLVGGGVSSHTLAPPRARELLGQAACPAAWALLD